MTRYACAHELMTVLSVLHAVYFVALYSFHWSTANARLLAICCVTLTLQNEMFSGLVSGCKNG